MIQTINVSGFKSEKIKQIQAIIEAFKAKNKLDNLANYQINPAPKGIINSLTETPVKVNGFLSREEIYER